MAQETAAQKTARLRAMRYARDGSPEELKAKKEAIKAYNERVRQHNTEQFFNNLREAMKTNPEGVLNAVVSGRVEKILKKFC